MNIFDKQKYIFNFYPKFIINKYYEFINKYPKYKYYNYNN